MFAPPAPPPAPLPAADEPEPITAPADLVAEEPSRPLPPARSAERPEQELHARPAALWRRLLATAIDTGILTAVVVGYLYLAAAIVGAKSEPSSAGGLDGIVHQLQAWSTILVPGVILALVLGGVYAGVFAVLWNGRTPGRLLLGIRLVDATGMPPRPTRAVIRAVLSVVSFVVLLAGFWLALFDRNGQTLHDKLTRTFVIQPS